MAVFFLFYFHTLRLYTTNNCTISECFADNRQSLRFQKTIAFPVVSFSKWNCEISYYTNTEIKDMQNMFGYFL